MIGQRCRNSKTSCIGKPSLDIIPSSRFTMGHRAFLMHSHCFRKDTFDTHMHMYRCLWGGVGSRARMVVVFGQVSGQRAVGPSTCDTSVPSAAPRGTDNIIEDEEEEQECSNASNCTNGVDTSRTNNSRTTDSSANNAITSINEARFQLKFVIPNLLSGCIIGKNGSNLDTIRSQTGAFIQANAPGYAVSSRKERFIIVASDSMEQCVQGISMMLKSIESDNKVEFLRNSRDGYLYLKQVIPGACAGSLIGMKGYNVERLSEECSVRIRVDSRPKNAGIVPFRLVSYAGSTVDQLITGLRGVVTCLEEDDRYITDIKAIKSIVLKVVQVPENRVGALIGPKGIHLQSLQQVLRCKLAISKSSSGGQVSHYLTAWGQPENVRAAIRIVFLNQTSTES